MFETLVRLKEEGRTRAIGVANFTVALLTTVVERDQGADRLRSIEYHVMLDQTPMRSYLEAKSIPLVAYCPLAQGRAASDETLIAIGRKHDATAAQVALKWLLDQDGWPRSPRPRARESQQANLGALDVRLGDRPKADRGAAEGPAICKPAGFARRGFDTFGIRE